ncbi:MAG: hypothetical protein WC869_12980 [Phycisphaerae bacterium]|jgi:hypothetical protein
MKHRASAILTAAALAAVIVLAVAIRVSAAAPKPAEVSKQWQLSAKFEPVLPIQVQLAGENRPRTFWYLRYTITNRTGDDRLFVPEFILYTDTGQILRAGRQVPSAVFTAIKRMYNDPLLLDAAEMTGKMLQGEDNAKEGVAIWPDFDPSAGSFDVFVSGLSGETKEVNLPLPIHVTETNAAGKSVDVVKTKIILSRTLQQHYQIPGEAAARLSTPVKLVEETWVMR